MEILLFAFVFYCIYLAVESYFVRKCRKAIPLVISVTGTRGKSSVVRLLTSIFEASGKKVIAKTTGTVPKLILPGGIEKEIKRRKGASIIEQKKLLKEAYDIQAEVLIAEMMSIHPENHYTEANRILRPDAIAVTNFRVDHIEAAGETEDEVKKVLCCGISDRSKVFLLEKYFDDSLKELLNNTDVKTIVEGNKLVKELSKIEPEILKNEFYENISLVSGIAEGYGIKTEYIIEGIKSVTNDPGKTIINKYITIEGKPVYLVNAFSANEPESTKIIIEQVNKELGNMPGKMTGFIVLRADRGDRTVQWINALNNGFSKYFDNFYVYGDHSKAMSRKCDPVIQIISSNPETITELLVGSAEEKGVILGCGNLVGDGQKIQDYWNKIGTPYGV